MRANRALIALNVLRRIEYSIKNEDLLRERAAEIATSVITLDAAVVSALRKILGSAI